MKQLKGMIAFVITLSLFCLATHNRLEAVTYVTDTGGYAYDEARASTNLAPAIALSTIALAAVIALAVQNTHGSSSSSSNHAHFNSCSCSSSSSSSSSSCSS